MKFLLGTVQFGLDYGINNSSGRVPAEEVESILRLAEQSGIRMLDTSFGYGESESVLGKFNQYDFFNFKIISKYPQNQKPVEEIFTQTLERLNCDRLYGYLIHHFISYRQNAKLWDSFIRLKERGKVEKIGFSLYSTEELDYLLDNNVQFDLIQIPYNIFDTKFGVYFEELKTRRVEIHTRSVYLQGLFFMNPESLNGKLVKLKPYLLALMDYCDAEQISVEQLALGFVSDNPYIDGVLIGIDTATQLKRNLEIQETKLKEGDFQFVRTIEIKEKEMLNPVNWK